MLIKIDDREKDSRKKSCQKFFEEHKYDVVEEHLTVGDYVFDDKICFEFKTAKDMIGSIKDGRVFRQARNMKQYSFSFVIIVGNVAEEINRQNKKQYWKKGSFTVKAYLGAVARLNTYSQVLVVDNQQQAWILMDSLVSKIMKDNVEVKMVDRPQNGLINPIASFLSCIYVSEDKRLPVRTALNIIDEFQLETLNDLLSLDYDMLIGMNGIGDKTARAILNTIN